MTEHTKQVFTWEPIHTVLLISLCALVLAWGYSSIAGNNTHEPSTPPPKIKDGYDWHGASEKERKRASDHYADRTGTDRREMKKSLDAFYGTEKR